MICYTQRVAGTGSDDVVVVVVLVFVNGDVY